MIIRKHETIISVLFLLFVFQSALERISNIFSYIDEMIVVAALILIIKKRDQLKRKLRKKKLLLFFLAFCLFFICGMIGNIRYHYQPWGVVAQDILVHLKFFAAILLGYYLLENSQWLRDKKMIRGFSNDCSYILFAIFILDRVFNFFGGQVRYGIRSAVLFFPHPTYFAGALAFLLACLAMTYDKRSRYAMLMDLLMMAFTLRSKAIVAAAAFSFMFWLMVLRKKKLKTWQIIAMSAAGVYIAWSQIDFYFIRLAGSSARSILLMTSLVIMRAYFPIGTGFATFASHMAGTHYSPVYVMYGFEDIFDVSSANPDAFLDDAFWPIIFGQTGVLGSACYLYILYAIGRRCFELKAIDKGLYMASLYSLVYLLIASIAEPIFNNMIAVPLGLLIGIAVKVGESGIWSGEGWSPRFQS